MTHPNRRFLYALAAAFAVVFVALGISPSYRDDWLLENWLVFAAVAALVAQYRRAPMSRGSYIAIFVFLCLHELGSHYTYSEVPYDEWWRRWIGSSLNEAMGWERNHYDRLVHLAYGLALAYPMREMLLYVVRDRGFWSFFLALNLTVATSAWYELLEWAAALLFAGDLGIAYLGTQGDVWDAQRDTGLATLGALVCMGATGALCRATGRDHAAEWVSRVRGGACGADARDSTRSQ
jgi:putative membrane protein